LNAAQGNPLVLADEQRVISVANFEMLALAAGLDLARIAFSPLLTSADERALKLLETPWSGLATGLAARPGHPRAVSASTPIAGEAAHRRGPACSPSRSRSSSRRAPAPR